MYDIAIVGAGPAGLSAAIYGTRAGKSVVVFEAMTYGGQIVNTPEIENYPGIRQISGFDFATGLYEQATGLGAEVVYEKVTGIEDKGSYKRVLTESSSYEARSVILATGAKNRPLGLDHEQELIGAGVSYCATCDGAFFKGKDVVVVGGGSTALEDAAYLCGYCRTVYLIHRRSQFRGEEAVVEKLRQKPNIIFELDSRVIRLNGESRLESIEVEQVQTGEIRTIPVDGLFVAIGQMPDNQAFSDLVNVDDAGYIRAMESCETNVPGIFTAGDCRTKKVRQLATAAADGAVAALAACEYLSF